jgi:hypothetical protein
LEPWCYDADGGKPKNWVEEPASLSHEDDGDSYDDDGEEEGGCGKWRSKFMTSL